MIDQASGIAPRWRSTLTACLTTFLILLALFWSTAQGMAYIWYNFETYTHGFLILPISLWLLWQKRRHLAAFSPQPTPVFLVLVFAGLAVWSLARLTGV
ncbi:MAG: archaeosortase/exosortase family protein, partial [Gammaproteobacteria bacterium]|nr:archaeosortase/exosortase family protein [Gammaproteobacteria bacterium]